MRYQYKILSDSNFKDDEEMVKVLNNLGRQGYELKAVRTGLIYLMKTLPEGKQCAPAKTYMSFSPTFDWAFDNLRND